MIHPLTIADFAAYCAYRLNIQKHRELYKLKKNILPIQFSNTANAGGSKIRRRAFIKAKLLCPPKWQ